MTSGGGAKPANIFLVDAPGAATVKVLGFSIAKIMAADEEGGWTRGGPGFSPDYASPEQVARGRTGPWTDVHALGLVLKEVLTGRSPVVAPISRWQLGEPNLYKP